MGGSDKNGGIPWYTPQIAIFNGQNYDNLGVLWVPITLNSSHPAVPHCDFAWLEGQKVAQSDVAPWIAWIFGPPIQVFVGFVVERHGTCPGKLHAGRSMPSMR